MFILLNCLVAMKSPALQKNLICLLIATICSLLIFSVLVVDVVNKDRPLFLSIRHKHEETTLKESKGSASNIKDEEKERQMKISVFKLNHFHMDCLYRGNQGFEVAQLG